MCVCLAKDCHSIGGQPVPTYSRPPSFSSLAISPHSVNVTTRVLHLHLRFAHMNHGHFTPLQCLPPPPSQSSPHRSKTRRWEASELGGPARPLSFPKRATIKSTSGLDGARTLNCLVSMDGRTDEEVSVLGTWRRGPALR